MIEYNLIRSKRKTLAIHIVNGKVVVKAPMRLSLVDIERFVTLKKEWINNHLKRSIYKKRQRDNFEFNYGDAVLFLGKRYSIIAKNINKSGFDGECFFMPQGFNKTQIKMACIKIYRTYAKKHIESRLEIFKAIMALSPESVKITNAKTRWGSCSIKRSISFSWRLMMADEDVVDYVIVHELAHLKEMNHSKKFWDIVEIVLPNYKDRRKKLNILGKKLGQENWD